MGRVSRSSISEGPCPKRRRLGSEGGLSTTAARSLPGRSPTSNASTPMLMTGKEYLQSIRDGRVIYVGKERVENQVTHPAFAAGARTYAAMFDLKADPALRDVMTFEEGGERYSMYYLQPRSQEDLRRRNRAHRKIADFCF